MFVLLSASAAHGDLVTHRIVGEITGFGDFTGGSIVAALDDQFDIGDEIIHLMEFDDAVADGNADPTDGSYLALKSLTATIGGSHTYTATGLNVHMFVFDNHVVANDYFSHNTVSPSGPAIGGFAPSGFQIVLRNTDRTAFSDDTLDQLPPADVSVFDDHGNTAYFFQNDDGFMTWKPTSWTAVPEGTASLYFVFLSVAVSGYSWFRRRFA